MTEVRHKLFSEDGNPSGGGGNFTITDILYSDLLSLYSGGTMTTGFYNITDRADNGIIVKANSATSLDLEGSGIFMNPDFQQIGDYSDVQILTSIPYNGHTYGGWAALQESGYGTGGIVFWNGIHYQILDASLLAGVNPALATAGIFQSLPKDPSKKYGYITETDFIEYNYENDSFELREDKRGNKIGSSGNMEFQFGNDSCSNNICLGDNAIQNVNQTGQFIGNMITGQCIVVQDETHTSIVGDTTFDGMGQNPTFTANFDTNVGAILSGCKVRYPLAITFDNAQSYTKCELNSFRSDFPFIKTFVGSGGTVFDFTTSYNYVGDVIVASSVSTKTIATLPNFPITQVIRFSPQSGLTITFTHGTGTDQPRCAGSISAILNGTNGDFIEFTKKSDGFIYQTGGETY